jgi:3-deoxy-manno-octulosonate cytidylyltransferase (CMP-KDO synthetase)
MQVLGIIPARYQSTRLPGKPLLDIAGKPMIQRVYEAARTAKLIDDIIIATDDFRILEAVQAFGAKAEMTAAVHPTGTDRLAEVAMRNPAEIVVNIQGDEPLIRGEVIDRVIQPLLDDPTLPMATARVVIDDELQAQEASVVKVVTDEQNNALYFSRALIPFPRNVGAAPFWKHVGLYVYRHDFLLNYINLPQTQLELAESLEQLRVLGHGYRIKVVEVKHDSVGVDTQEDLELVRRVFEKSGADF